MAFKILSFLKNFFNQKKNKNQEKILKQQQENDYKDQYDQNGKINNFNQLKDFIMNVNEEDVLYEKRIGAILEAKKCVLKEEPIKNIKKDNNTENIINLETESDKKIEKKQIENTVSEDTYKNVISSTEEQEDNNYKEHNKNIPLFDNFNYNYNINLKFNDNVSPFETCKCNITNPKVSAVNNIITNKDSKIDNIINLNEIEENVKISDIVPVDTAIDITAAEIKEIKQENEKIEINYCISNVIDYASMIPSEIIEERYKIIEKNCYCPNKNISDDDLLKLLKINPYIESLDLSDCDNIYNFKIVESFENLKELSVNNCDNFEDLRSISNCKNLVVLNIGNTKVKDLDTIKNFQNLEIFNCSCNIIRDANPLMYCKKLKEIVLWNCISIDNIDFISELTDLIRLDIDYTSISDLNCLKDCKNLEILFMDNCNFIKDFSFLRSLGKLKCILADGTNLLTYHQLQNFSDLYNLEILTLNNRRIIDVSSFSKLLKLKELVMSGCNVTDLSWLENLSMIKKLDLTANSMLKDLSPLYKMTNLNKLLVGGGGQVKLAKASKNLDAVSNMSIENIDVVRNFTKLVEINLSANNKLKDISALEPCSIMEEVYLQNCMQLEDVSVLGKLKTLMKVHLSSNPRIKNLYFMNNLPNLLEFLYDGTSVYTPGLMSTFKKANSVYLLKGNAPDIVSLNMLKSGKKKCKLQKSLRKFFKKK